jgi:hypothetical protein
MPRFDNGIWLSIGTGKLIAIMLNETTSWKNKIQESLRITSNQQTHDIIPSFFHLA